MTAVLEAIDVSKAFQDWSREPRTLRGVVARRAPLLRPRSEQRMWALRDVSFRLQAGRSLGLIGHNGAGKSTLLRLASGLGRPTRGSFVAHPDSASVLTLGASFDAQLTGVENAYTAALVSGLGRRQAAQAVDEIISFSGLEEFANAPVRTYSDGMKLRLAFAVVVVRRPKLLLLDEVLAVGDLGFRQRCEAWIEEARAEGTSLLLASHSLGELVETCDDALWLHHGRVRGHGPAAAVVEAYEKSMLDQSVERTPVGAGRNEDGLVLGENRFGSQQIRITEVRIEGGALHDGATSIATGARVRIALALETDDEPVRNPIVSLTLRRSSDDFVVFDANTLNDRLALGGAVRRARVEMEIDRLDLQPGDYSLDAGVYEASWEHAYDFHYRAYGLEITGGPGPTNGLLRPPYRWELT